jgi:hypothetical protein
MIGYFVMVGDIRVGNVFNPYYVAFNKLVKRNINPKTYGIGLELILIEYHLEGEFLALPEEKYRLKSYRKNERSIAVAVGVSLEFGKMSDIEKRKFIVDTTIVAVRLAQEKMDKLGFVEIDFPQLFADIDKCAIEYMGLSSITDIT